MTVVATDRDGDQVQYRTIGDGNAPQFFQVNSVTGDVSAVQDLRLDDRLTYTVSSWFLG